MFQLHPQLVKDTQTIGYFALSQLLISRDANYPWFILVPRIKDVFEFHHLNASDQQQVLQESCALSSAMEALFKPDKLNVAALGNQVPQLHIHHIARYANDPAWPKPIWGAVPAVEYPDDLVKQRVTNMIEVLKDNAGFHPAC